MTPFYPPEQTTTSRSLYEDLRRRYANEGGCTLIGGWAVDELTTPAYQEQSRDVDIVFSTKAAFNTFRHQVMPEWSLEWAGTARRPTNACRFKKGHGPPGIAVDLFFLEGSDACQQRFHTMGGPLYKRLDCSQWLPRLADLVEDKVRTLPLRGSQDAGGKRFKDAIDTWALVFYNVQERLPMELRAGLPPAVLRGALAEMPNLESYSDENGGLYAEALVELEAWLRG